MKIEREKERGREGRKKKRVSKVMCECIYKCAQWASLASGWKKILWHVTEKFVTCHSVTLSHGFWTPSQIYLPGLLAILYGRIKSKSVTIPYFNWQLFVTTLPNGPVPPRTRGWFLGPIQASANSNGLRLNTLDLLQKIIVAELTENAKSSGE